MQETSTEGKVNSHQTRDAWCYGTAVVGRSLYLVRVTPSISQYQEISLEAFHAIENRAGHNLDGITFCHGKSDLLHRVNRVYSNTHDEQLLPLCTRLLSDLIQSADRQVPLPNTRHEEYTSSQQDRFDRWFIGSEVDPACCNC